MAKLFKGELSDEETLELRRCLINTCLISLACASVSGSECPAGRTELEREGGLEDPTEVKGRMRISDSWER